MSSKFPDPKEKHLRLKSKRDTWLPPPFHELLVEKIPERWRFKAQRGKNVPVEADPDQIFQELSREHEPCPLEHTQFIDYSKIPAWELKEHAELRRMLRPEEYSLWSHFWFKMNKWRQSKPYLCNYRERQQIEETKLQDQFDWWDAIDYPIEKYNIDFCT